MLVYTLADMNFKMATVSDPYVLLYQNIWQVFALQYPSKGMPITKLDTKHTKK